MEGAHDYGGALVAAGMDLEARVAALEVVGPLTLTLTLALTLALILQASLEPHRESEEEEGSIEEDEEGCRTEGEEEEGLLERGLTEGLLSSFGRSAL